MTLQEALGILELASIERLSPEDMPRLVRRARKRWHPDAVSWRNNLTETNRYTRNFQAIETACAVLLGHLQGARPTGVPTQGVAPEPEQATVKSMRETVPEMHREIGQHWGEIRRRKYRWSTERVVVAAGRKLREMLAADFKDDVAALAVISLCFGPWPFMFVTMLLYAIHPILGWLGGVGVAGQVLACVGGMLPLARYWLNERVVVAMLWFINFGLQLFHWAQRKTQADPWWAQLIVQAPALVALLIKNVVLRPMFWLAECAVGEKTIGVVEKTVEYYAGFADWYIEHLLNQPADKLREEELLHLTVFARIVREFANEQAKRG